MKTKKTTSASVLIYGLFVLGAGLIAYFEKGSAASLYVSSAFGSLLLISSILMFCQKQIGAYMALLLTLCLAATFAIRYSLTGKGIMATLAVFSGAMLLFLLAKTVNWKK